MFGLFREPEATARTLRDGWLHSDHGLLDEHGHLIVVDRLNDLMRLQDGTAGAAISGEQAEVRPVHQEVVVFANDRPFVAALLNIDFDVSPSGPSAKSPIHHLRGSLAAPGDRQALR